MTTYYYQRISTKSESDKQSFTRYAEENGLTYNERYIYKDDVTGSTFNRKEWLELEKNIRKGDTIIFKEISRFTRQANEGYDKYMELMNKGINLIFLDNPTVSTDYIKQLTNIADSQQLVTKTALEGTIKLLLIVELDRVQQEREIIVKRIKQGIEASDKINGRPKGKVAKLSDELRTIIINEVLNGTKSKLQLSKETGYSRNTIDKYVKIVKEELTN